MISTGIRADHALDGLVLTLVDRCDRPADQGARLARYDAHLAWIESCNAQGIPIDSVVYRVLAAWAHMSPLGQEVVWDGAAASVAVKEGKRPLATEPTAEHRRQARRRIMRLARDCYGDEVGLADYATRRRLIHAARAVSHLELMEIALFVEESRRPPWDDL